MNSDHSEIVARSTWGTGYGNVRHLIGRSGIDGTRSRCHSGAYRLDFFDGDTEKRFGNPQSQAHYVTSKKPCKVCLKLAGVSS